MGRILGLRSDFDLTRSPTIGVSFLNDFSFWIHTGEKPYETYVGLRESKYNELFFFFFVYMTVFLISYPKCVTGRCT